METRCLASKRKEIPAGGLSLTPPGKRARDRGAKRTPHFQPLEIISAMQGADYFLFIKTKIIYSFTPPFSSQFMNKNSFNLVSLRHSDTCPILEDDIVKRHIEREGRKVSSARPLVANKFVILMTKMYLFIFPPGIYE